MKKLFTFLSVALLLSCGGEKSPSKIDATTVKNNFAALEEFEKKTGGADILFNEYEYEFPPMEQGDVLYHSFFFVNNGDEPLILTNVKGSCGCTNVEYPEQPIMPGEKGSITAEINTESKAKGKSFRVQVKVESNATENNNVKLWLRGVPNE